MRSPNLKVTKDGLPIQLVALHNKKDMGLKIGGLPGNIPLQNEMEACNQANYRFFHDWPELTEHQKALILGQYFNKQMIQAHRDDTAMTEIERSRKRGKKK